MISEQYCSIVHSRVGLLFIKAMTKWLQEIMNKSLCSVWDDLYA